MLNKSGARSNLDGMPFLRCRNLLRGPLPVVIVEYLQSAYYLPRCLGQERAKWSLRSSNQAVTCY